MWIQHIRIQWDIRRTYIFYIVRTNIILDILNECHSVNEDDSWMANKVINIKTHTFGLDQKEWKATTTTTTHFSNSRMLYKMTQDGFIQLQQRRIKRHLHWTNFIEISVWCCGTQQTNQMMILNDRHHSSVRWWRCVNELLHTNGSTSYTLAYHIFDALCYWLRLYQIFKWSWQFHFHSIPFLFYIVLYCAQRGRCIVTPKYRYICKSALKFYSTRRLKHNKHTHIHTQWQRIPLIYAQQSQNVALHIRYVS